MRRSSLLLILAFVSSSVLLAQDVDVPLRNWTVPPYTAASAAGGIQTMTDVTGPRAFVGVAPCRIADTRGLGFSGQAGPPALNTGPRVFQISGTVAGIPTQCGIPATAEAVSFQFTIVSPNTAGNLVAWPGGTAPTISVLNWSAGETALGNGTIVPLSPSGSLSVQINAAVGGATGNLVLDVNGYFATTFLDPSEAFVIATNSTAFVAGFENLHPGCTGSCGVVVRVGGNNFTDAILGHALSNTGNARGVVGATATQGNESAGVAGFASAPSNATLYGPTGVRGHGSTIGVLGVSGMHGVMGDLVQSSAVQARGLLGYDNGPTNYGMYATANAHVEGIFTAGNKMFVQPHPTDPTKEIRYVSLEGPSAEIYFRGSSRIQRGLTRIELPEHFRLVARPGTYSTLVTPVGSMATVAVLSEDESGIVVRASRDVKIHYVVYAERDAFRDHEPIADSEHFRTKYEGADNWHLQNIPESFKRLLIQNGTLNEDGTANEETARRVGWELVPALEAGAPSRPATSSNP